MHEKVVYSIFTLTILSMLFFACGGSENKENKSQTDSSQSKH
jgi:ABC-type Fe3+-citrate transport system substrate-binding protein